MLGLPESSGYPICFLKKNMSHVGILDTFGRTHWMKTSQVKEMNARWRKEFKVST